MKEKKSKQNSNPMIEELLVCLGLILFGCILQVIPLTAQILIFDYFSAIFVIGGTVGFFIVFRWKREQRQKDNAAAEKREKQKAEWAYMIFEFARKNVFFTNQEIANFKDALSSFLLELQLMEKYVNAEKPNEEFRKIIINSIQITRKKADEFLNSLKQKKSEIIDDFFQTVEKTVAGDFPQEK